MASLQSNFPISCYPVSAPAEFQFDFTEDNAHSDNVHAMLFDYNDLNRIGLDGYLICSIDALNQDLCTKDQLGSFIAGNTNSIPLKGGKQTIPVAKSGYWCMVHDATQTPKINIVNQQLQLPAPYLPLLNFYYYMTLIYLGIGIYYMVNSIKHLGVTTKLNYYILGMTWLSMLEMALGYGYYMYWGTYGVTSPLLLFLFAVMTSGRNTVLLLTFHATCKQILKRYKLYLSLYGLSSFVYFLHVLNPQQEHVLFFVALPLALLSTIFVNHILAHAQPQLMQLFSITGVGFVVLALLHLLFIYHKQDRQFYVSTWPYRWLVLDALPQLLVFGLIVGLVVLFKADGSKKKGYELVEELKNSEEGKND